MSDMTTLDAVKCVQERCEMCHTIGPAPSRHEIGTIHVKKIGAGLLLA